MIGEVGDVKKLLAKGADANTKSGNRPVITWAAQSGQIEVVKLLLEAKADIDATDGIGQTAVMRAVAMGHKDMVDELIKAKANLNIRDTQGRTALTIAKDEAAPEMVALLSAHGAEQ